MEEDTYITPVELKAYRNSINFTQEEMAARLGFSTRNYQDIESGKTKIAGYHHHSIISVSMLIATQYKNPDYLIPQARKLVQEFNKIKVLH